MAFGKKKDDAGEPVDEIELADDLDADDVASDGPDADAAADATEPAPDGDAPEAPAAEAPPPAGGSDALLSMFQESKDAVDDLGVLVELAGDADLDDILEELRTLRAALGITYAYEDEPELAAAA